MSFLKVWGCDAYVKVLQPDKIQPKAEKCVFIGYPKETAGYTFYHKSEGKIFVARNGAFLETEFLSREVSGKKVELDEVLEPSSELESSAAPEEILALASPRTEGANDANHETPVVTPTEIRRSSRPHNAPERYEPVMNILLLDNNDDEPTNYEEAMMGPEYEKWRKAMESKIESMKENQVWTMVHLPEERKPVGCKWGFKRKTDADGNITVYKARLVTKGFRQIQGIDYDETFSPVAMLKSVRILLATAAYFDYKIWQMDVKTAFLNGMLSEDVCMIQPEGFVNPQYARKVCNCLLYTSPSPRDRG